MKFSKITICAALAAATATLSAKEIATYNEPGDWYRSNVFVKTPADTLTTNTSGKLMARNTIHVNPEKSYRFSLKVRHAAGSTPAGFYMILEPFSEEGKAIAMNHVTTIRNSSGVLGAEAKAGDNFVMIKADTPASYSMVRSWVICFNAKDDMSDLPNRDISDNFKAVEKVDNMIKVTFRTPLKKGYPVGTRVRIHAGGSYIYVGEAARTKGEWTELSGTVKGIAPSWSNKTFPIGTATFTPGMLANWGTKGSVIEIKDVKVEEL